MIRGSRSTYLTRFPKLVATRSDFFALSSSSTGSMVVVAWRGSDVTALTDLGPTSAIGGVPEEDSGGLRSDYNTVSPPLNTVAHMSRDFLRISGRRQTSSSAASRSSCGMVPTQPLPASGTLKERRPFTRIRDRAPTTTRATRFADPRASRTQDTRDRAAVPGHSVRRQLAESCGAVRG